MTTQALVSVLKGGEPVITIYCATSGYLKYTGVSIKNCLEKATYGPDHLFREDCRKEYFDKVGWDKAPKTFEERMGFKIPEVEINYHVGGPANKTILNEYSLATRLCAGLFASSNELGCPNEIQIYAGKRPENIEYHYEITLRDYGNLKKPNVLKKPYVVATVGYKGDVIYSGWVDEWVIPGDESRGNE